MKTIQCNGYDIHVNDWSKLRKQISDMKPSAVFVLTDEHVEKFCLHIILEQLDMTVQVIRIPSGEHHKKIATCEQVWARLLQSGADRHALLINLGGGVIGDLGGFCAATYMRGIRFIQMPTTLLSQVDASVGGKLGVDFMGIKNLIGLIRQPEAVYIFTAFLDTLPHSQLRSGYAELLKHGLIADKQAWMQLSTHKDVYALEYESLICDSLEIKRQITDQDPNEQGIRKILNFGHTIGHALESYWLDSRTPLLHGEAVAIGMVSESFLSYRAGNIPESDLFDIRKTILRIYGHHPKFVKPYNDLIEIMHTDKKNKFGELRFSLLKELGNGCFDIPVTADLVEESLIFYQEKIG
jgi:3-dehydroquinate synthase